MLTSSEHTVVSSTHTYSTRTPLVCLKLLKMPEILTKARSPTKGFYWFDQYILPTILLLTPTDATSAYPSRSKKKHSTRTNTPSNRTTTTIHTTHTTHPVMPLSFLHSAWYNRATKVKRSAIVCVQSIIRCFTHK